MTKAIVTAFHKYTPFGGEYYEPMLDFYLQQMRKWVKEYDKIYLVDSNWDIDLFGKYKAWNITTQDWNVEVIKVDPSLRYYDAYKKVLPDIKETAVLFMDNDMVIYKPKMIEDAFEFLREGYQVVSILDTIGKTFPEIGYKSKVCPYWLCTRKELLMNYLKVDWSPDKMPDYETMGQLTEAFIIDRVKIYEWEEDKNSIYYDGTKDEKKNLGYYHIRSGSVPAYLLATKKYGNQETYWNYINGQPKIEYLRQCAWYEYMGGDATEIIIDAGVENWNDYMSKFIKFHGLV